MLRKQLGTTGLRVSPLMFGGNVLGWTADDAMSFKLLDAWVDAGFNFIDTANNYSVWAAGHVGGESETVIGKWLKSRGNRNRVIIATKVGMEITPERKGLKRDYILRSADQSLQKLQTEYIDLYQSHIDDPDTPLEETLEAYSRLVAAGKVRTIGASNYKADRLSSALQVSRDHGYPVYQSLQPLYNLCDRQDFEDNLAPLCLKENLGVIPYAALSGGFLTGKYRTEADRSQSPRGGRMDRRMNERGFRILDALDKVATDYKAAPATIAVAWVMSRPAVTAPIVSATNLKQLDEIIAATNFELDSSSAELLNAASAP